jgi:hypothetical protein
VGVAAIIAAFVLILYLMPPPGEILLSAMELQRWLSVPVGISHIRTATRAECIFGTGLFVALLVSSFNWVDAFLDFLYQYRRRPGFYGDFLAARSNFRRESYRLWRLSAMCTIAVSLFFNWGLSTLIITFGLLIFAYSEAVNSSLDRLYRIGAQRLFREEREKRRKLLELARAARSAKVVADAEAISQAERIVALETESEDREGQSDG